MSVRPEKLRAWWSHKQALDGRQSGAPPADVLRETGWARSVGGVGPYLTLFARGGTSREAVDLAVAGLQIHELPSARGCTYVVPASDFALALKAGEPFTANDMKTGYKLGVTDKEIDKLCDAVVDALASGPLSPDEIREGTGSASRNLGEAGKKKGLTTTLPLALGKLQSSGDIRRVPMNGRLDQQRYKYSLWRPNPMANFKLSGEEVQTELARRYFKWAGPATLAEFQWFSGLGVKAAKAAIAPLRLETVDPDRLLFSEDREALERFEIPEAPQFSLVSSIDGISLLRRDLNSIVDPEHRKLMVTAESAGGALMDLPSHAILDRGRVVGIWEFDPEAQRIVWLPFVRKSKDLEKAVVRSEEYVRDQLGDARSFSLDSPKSRVPRLQALRTAANRRED
ncbi:MAG: crosslink repair DNA glycosylase YcaQ family protein [Bryobacteraceae bacterium]